MLWLHSLKVAQLLRSAACLHTNQSRSYLNHLVLKNVLGIDVRFAVLTMMTMKIATFLQVMLIGRRLHISSKCLYSRITPAKSR